MKHVFNLWPFIVGGWEVLSHAIPSEKNYSITHKIGIVIKTISEFLNVKRGKLNNKFPLIIAICLLFVSCSTIKNTKCMSIKYVDVTYVTKDSIYYTVHVPYCDTLQTGNSIDELKTKAKQ